MESKQSKSSTLDRKMVKVGNTIEDPSKRKLRVLSWNVLADKFCDDFPRVDDQYLKWEYRQPLFLEELTRNPQDLICLCEVDHFGDFFEPMLKEKNFEGTFIKKDRHHDDGSALFFNTERFELVMSEKDKYSGYVQLYIINLLRDKASTEKNNLVLVATTHLKAKNTPENEEIRVAECAQLQEKMKSLSLNATKLYIDESATSGIIPMLICGDFNSTPSGEVYSLMKESELNLSSSYFNTFVSESEPKFTTQKIRRELTSHTIDYIWSSANAFQTLEVLSIPTTAEIGNDALPSKNYPSDHVAIAAVLQFS